MEVKISSKGWVVIPAGRAGPEVGYVSIINIGETVYITERECDSSKAARVLGLIDQLPLVQLPATRTRILAAAHVKANAAISYADAFVVAAAQEFGAVILTGDPEFRSIHRQAVVEWLPTQ